MADPSDADAPRGIEVARITIVKTFDDEAEGSMAVWTTSSQGLSLIDAMGMLAFSSGVVYRDFGPDSPDDDSEA